MFSTLLDIASTVLGSTLQTANDCLNDNLNEYSPASIVWLTAGSILLVKSMFNAYQLYQHNDYDAVKNKVVDFAVIKVLNLPFFGKKVGAYINEEVHKALDSLKISVAEFDKTIPDLPTQLPMDGSSSDKILSVFSSLPNNKCDYKKSGAVYVHIAEPLKNLLGQVSILTNYTNPMHDHWLFLNRLQGRVINMTKNLFHGPEGTYGIITHGGTTSILEACKSYVLYAREVLLIDRPEIIVPQSAHPAFEKAAKILNAGLRIAPLNKQTGQVDILAIEKLINAKTCMLVGSAPSYPYGTFDDIITIGKLGIKYNKPVHVDACLGGFLSVFADDVGVALPAWDFSVPGVMSISADIHKYGYSPKGTSLVFFHPACNASPTYTNLTSSCGMYVTEGIDGSRSGQPIAEAFTILMYYGKNRYIAEAGKIFNTRKALVDALDGLDGIQVMYNPQHAVVGIQGDGRSNLSVIAEQFQKLGWSVNALPTNLGIAFHFCITSVHANEPTFISSFIKDMTTAINYAKANPEAKASGMVKAYGQLSTQFAPNYVKNLIGDFFCKIRTMPDEIPGFSITDKPSSNLT